MWWPFKKKKQFSKLQLRTIKHALDYTWHRMEKHDHCGVRGVINEERLSTLRKQLQ